jgi:hypothetical protein
MLVTAGVLPGLWRLDGDLAPTWEVRWPIGHTVGAAEVVSDLYEGWAPASAE